MQLSWKTPRNPVGGIFCVRTILIQLLDNSFELETKGKHSDMFPSLCGLQSGEKQTDKAMLLDAYVLRHLQAVRNADVCSLPPEILMKMPYETHVLRAYL